MRRGTSTRIIVEGGELREERSLTDVGSPRAFLFSLVSHHTPPLHCQLTCVLFGYICFYASPTGFQVTAPPAP